MNRKEEKKIIIKIIINNKKMKELKDKIIKANPSILNLKFGCEIITKDGLIVFFESNGNNWYGEDEKYFIGQHKNTYEKLRIYYKEIEEIIGRPIELADIFILFEKHNVDFEITTVYGKILTILITDKENNVFAINWELNKKLDEQFDIVIKRLLRAIK